MTAAHTNGSGLNTKLGPRKPHLLESNGIGGEVAKQRQDFDAVTSVLAAVTIDEFLAPAAADTDGIKTSVATSTDEQVYADDDLNGAVGGSTMSPPRNVTVTASDSAGSYAGSVTFSGWDVNGNAISESLALTNNATTTGNKAFAKVTSVAVPEQNDTSGALQFGFGTKLGFMKKVKLRGTAVARILELVNGVPVSSKLNDVPIRVDEFTDPAAADTDGIKTSIASAASAQTYSGAALNGVVGAATMSPPRNITVTTGGDTASDAPATATITGLDVNGDVITEAISVSQTAATAAGNKAFAKVTSIALTAGDGTGATLEFGFGLKLGLSQPIKQRAGMPHALQEIAIGSVVTTGTVVAAATGAPNGTYAPASAPDGSKDYALTYEVDATATTESTFATPDVGAPNGTYDPGQAPNGSRKYAIYYEVDAPAVVQ